VNSFINNYLIYRFYIKI